MPYTATEIAMFAEEMFRVRDGNVAKEWDRLYLQHFGEYVGNRVDEVLGFRAPKWLDEPLLARRIDRQKDSKEVVEAALHNIEREYRNRLAHRLEECAASARVLGLKVISDDAHAAAAAVRSATGDVKTFFSHRHDPRGEL